MDRARVAAAVELPEHPPEHPGVAVAGWGCSLASKRGHLFTKAEPAAGD